MSQTITKDYGKVKEIFTINYPYIQVMEKDSIHYPHVNIYTIFNMTFRGYDYRDNSLYCVIDNYGNVYEIDICRGAYNESINQPYFNYDYKAGKKLTNIDIDNLQIIFNNTINSMQFRFGVINTIKFIIKNYMEQKKINDENKQLITKLMSGTNIEISTDEKSVIIESLKFDIQKETEKHNEEICKLKQEICKLKQEIDKCKQLNDSNMNELIVRHKKEKNDLFESTKLNIQKENEKHNEEICKLKQEIDKYKQLNDFNKNKQVTLIVQHQKETEQLKNKINTYKTEISELIELNKTSSSKKTPSTNDNVKDIIIDQLTSELLELKSNNTQLIKDYNNLTQKYNDLNDLMNY